MARFNNPMEIFKLTDASNCRQCGEKTCMAFAVAVFKGKKSLERCPKIDGEVLEKFKDGFETPDTIDEFMEKAINQLAAKIPETDLAGAAQRTGGHFDGNRLSVRIMGKTFSVDTQGNLSADIHVNAWVAVPFLNYVLYAKGTFPTGRWITFREIRGGPERLAHFRQNCEKPIKKLADNYTGLFSDMLELFSGRRQSPHQEADISLVLHPLPLLPVMFCYWEPEEAMDSSLHIFFDKSADDNLDAESIYTICAGMAKMFEKIADRNRPASG